jgi:hypothetical protein
MRVPPREREQLVTTVERIETAGDEAHGSKSRSRRANDLELLAQPLACQKRRFGVDVASRHVAHHELVDVEPIDERTNPGKINEAAEPFEERRAPIQHGRQRPSPRGSDQDQPRRG